MSLDVQSHPPAAHISQAIPYLLRFALSRLSPRREGGSGDVDPPEGSHLPGRLSSGLPAAAEAEAKALTAGTDLVLGFDVCEASVLYINTQHPVTHGHASLLQLYLQG